jgi:DNA-binding NtrC family response regulator
MKEKILIVEDQFVEADYLRSLLEQAGYQVTGIARSVEQARELIRELAPGFVLVDIFLKGKHTGIDLARQLAEDAIPFIYLSANSGKDVLEAAKTTQPYGFLVKPFRENDLLVTLEIARYRHQHSTQHKDRQTTELLSRLKTIDNPQLSFEQRILNIGMAIQAYIPFDYLTIGFDEPIISFLRIGFNEYQTIITQPSLKEQMRSSLPLPLELPDKKTLKLCLYSRRPEIYNADHIALFQKAQKILSELVSKILNEPSAPAPQKNNLPDKKESHLQGIIGKSHVLLNIFDLITQVAYSDTSVLILGDSGTGKEKIADAIHQSSPRKNKPLIKVNCAALPGALIESELFGHEKGAFTGALDKRIGKFEQAEGGTIFLDEIGEMPVELQVKLLRVLQEREIERLGGRQPIKVNVRIIAATNRNLEKEVAEGRFRLDLYYRLNVFPITLPPLKDRKEDIPLLARHFLDHYNKKAGKKITAISDRVLRDMMAYDWPGNIRELQHLMERSVLLTKGQTIEDIPLPLSKIQETNTKNESHIKTIHENEKDHIIAVLKKCHGRIWGPGAAAEILNIPPSTLKYKMKKLGIRKEYIP